MGALTFDTFDTFDTYEAIKRLTDSGLDEQQAKAVTETIKAAQDAHLNELTKKDLLELQTELMLEIKNVIITLGALMVGLAGLVIAWFELRG
ncbi:MAG: hypothetical protein CL911_03465 [Deltaproteobacteria bacterium]|nr:hypothetical protein [Deltaproteobacteria bacterium]